MLVMCEASMASAMPDSVAAIIPRVGANLQLLIAEAPENPRGRLIRYMLTALSPRTDTARREAVLREWRELAQHFPESKDPSEPEWGRAECWGWLGAVLLARGRPDEAAEAFERALADRGDFWWVRVIALPQARASRLPHLGGQAGDAPQGD